MCYSIGAVTKVRRRCGASSVSLSRSPSKTISLATTSGSGWRRGLLRQGFGSSVLVTSLKRRHAASWITCWGALVQARCGRMCGGRACLLQRIATHSYDNADEEVCKGLEPENLHPEEVPACWTGDAYMQIMEALCKHPDGVMPSRSSLARDLSWYKGSRPVVMPVSLLWVMWSAANKL